jgi:hypothetical protein
MLKLVMIIGALFVIPAYADRDQHDDRDHGDPGHRVYGAPGPIAGAGLPVLAVGYALYWLVRRRRKSQ